jgi:hypothetical protein
MGHGEGGLTAQRRLALARKEQPQEETECVDTGVVHLSGQGYCVLAFLLAFTLK